MSSDISRLRVEDTLENEDYDEFGFLDQNAEEWGIAWTGRPQVARRQIEVAPGKAISYISWGTGAPEMVFLHGGGQNAHTRDTVMLALGRPALALDLPGHGRSYHRDDRNYGPWANAEAIEAVLARIAPSSTAVIGMSLGGATAIRLAAIRPDLARRLVIVDVTPQVNDPSRHLSPAQQGAVSLVSGPADFPTFADMADTGIASSPARPAAAVRRGVRHNAIRLPDGHWRWRYDLFGARDPAAGNWLDFSPLWYDVNRISIPTMFLRGALSPFVSDGDIERMLERLPGLRLETVADAGHAIQSDQPLVMARLLQDFVPRSA